MSGAALRRARAGARRRLLTTLAACLAAVTPLVVPVAVPTPASAQETTTAYVTGYTWWDNTPTGAAISYPTRHATAGGTGTYEDPVTLAVGHSRASGVDVPDFVPGRMFYLPALRRYFLVEDTCGDGPTPENLPCHTGVPAGTAFWVDAWVDGSTVPAAAAGQCAAAVTGAHAVLLDPSPGYAVTAGPLATTAGCTPTYDETPVQAESAQGRAAPSAAPGPGAATPPVVAGPGAARPPVVAAPAASRRCTRSRGGRCVAAGQVCARAGQRARDARGRPLLCSRHRWKGVPTGRKRSSVAHRRPAAHRRTHPPRRHRH